MALNRRAFLVLGTGLGLGCLVYIQEARAEEGEDLTYIKNSPQDQEVVSGFIGPLNKRHSGFMVQSSYGDAGNNFEVVFPSLHQGLAHIYRNNGASGLPWNQPSPAEFLFNCFTTDSGFHGSYLGSGRCSDVSLIQSDFKDDSGNDNFLELVVRYGDRLAHYWRSSGSPFYWTGPQYIPSPYSHTGNPALIQGDFDLVDGTMGNLELVVPHADSGLVHYTRFKTNYGPPVKNVAQDWGSPNRFGEGLVDAVALIQSHYKNADEVTGHLEVVARVSDKLYHFWRESKEPYEWIPINDPITDGLETDLKVSGLHGFIESLDKDFQVVTPLENGGIAHICRQNTIDGSWKLISIFGKEHGSFDAISLLQSDFGEGNLEILARLTGKSNQFLHFFFDGSTWQQGGQFQETIEDNFADMGQWIVPYTLDFGAVGMHSILLPTGNVLFMGYEFEDFQEQDEINVSVLNLNTGQQVSVPPNPQYNKFCGGHAFLSDGSVVVAAGNVTPKSAESLHVFIPQGEGGTWQDFSPMSGGIRWYPTCTTLPSGQVFILGGTEQVYTTIKQKTCAVDYTTKGTTNNENEVGKPRQVNKSYEIFDGSTKKPKTLLPEVFDFCQESLGLYGLYPFVFVLPDGRLFIHGNTHTYLLELETGTTEKLPFTTQIKTSRTYPSQGSAVLLPLLPESNYQARIMLIGGGVSCEYAPNTPTTNCDPNGNQNNPVNVEPIDPVNGEKVQTCNSSLDSWQATNTCEILNMDDLGQEWELTPPMKFSRIMPDAILLPDGTVFVTGGSTTGTADTARNPVFQAELYDPKINQWTSLGSMHVPRIYHAAAILLPSGEVMTSGTDKLYNISPFNQPEQRIEVFRPPYLFRGPRPIINTAPDQVTYEQSFTVDTPDADDITVACFIAPGAASHSFNMHQRYVGLGFSIDQTSSQLTLVAPPNANIAPPGYYMMFLLNSDGVPSEAKFIQLI